MRHLEGGMVRPSATLFVIADGRFLFWLLKSKPRLGASEKFCRILPNWAGFDPDFIQ